MPSPVLLVSRTDCGDVAHLLENGLVQIRLCCAVVIRRLHLVRQMGSRRHAQATKMRAPSPFWAPQFTTGQVLKTLQDPLSNPAEADSGRAPSA